jgi:hypothetical protein
MCIHSYTVRISPDDGPLFIQLTMAYKKQRVCVCLAGQTAYNKDIQHFSWKT